MAHRKHFTSWLTLAPKNDHRGGSSVLGVSLPQTVPRHVAHVRHVVGRTSTALGAYYRNRHALANRAITATARKLAILVYRV
jgi:hypothetical protein